MSTQEPGRAPQTPALTSLPRLDDLERVEGGGFDEGQVREAFDSFRRHALQLQAQLRVLQAAGKTAHVDPTGHAVRMDALHLIRAAAEFADALERDAANASAAQLGRTEEEVTRRQRELQDREAEIGRFRDESERQRTEIITAAKREAREIVTTANDDATREVREAEARAARLLEQARHNATELTNAVRAEVEQTLEWARAQAGAVMARAQQAAEQLLAAAGMGADQLHEVSSAIVRAAEASVESTRAGVRAEAVGPRAVEPVAGEPPSAAAPAADEPDEAGEAEGEAVDEEEPAVAPASEPESGPPAGPLLPPVSPPPPVSEGAEESWGAPEPEGDANGEPPQDEGSAEDRDGE